jgi:hypothetical protein
MYRTWCKPPFETWVITSTTDRYRDHTEGPACYGHAEIHLYNISSITSLRDDEIRPHDIVKESHTFGFPVYTMVFQYKGRVYKEDC